MEHLKSKQKNQRLLNIQLRLQLRVQIYHGYQLVMEFQIY
ncbi:unnamed protein product [Paramecium sonneborni]|uniref:Uncharacterized protein n=1 Tax=Paramecium sonneborni TaxID=65129 RepID=A0A8S1RQQ2_9CILI|nr:unnamed protein product [Paramecium sonneborni]